MSFPWKQLAVLVLWVLSASGSTAVAQEKKDRKADDDQMELNKALKEAAGLGKVEAVK